MSCGDGGVWGAFGWHSWSGGCFSFERGWCEGRGGGGVGLGGVNGWVQGAFEGYGRIREDIFFALGRFGRDWASAKRRRRDGGW